MDSNYRLQIFLDELVRRVTKQYRDQIISMVLFGSATTGEWVKGKSDIDCIVLIKDRIKIQEIEQYLHKTLLELDVKYDLKLSKTCTTYKKTQNQALKLVLKMERFTMFGRPFYVLSEDQLDLKNAKIKDDLKAYVGTHVIASVNLFFHRIKSTGKVLYGKDVTKEFPTRIPPIEKIKASLNALLLLMVSFVTIPLDPSFALQHAIKANFWACDNVLFAFEIPLSNTELEIVEIQKIFRDSNTYLDVTHLHTSLKYKRTKNITNLTKRFVFRYVIKSTRFVMRLYFMTLQKQLFSI